MVSTAAGNVTVQGTTLEQPPSQPNGGGFNSSLSVTSITAATPLAPGASVDVRFLLGLQQTGTFRFLIQAEGLTRGTIDIAGDIDPAPDLALTKTNDVGGSVPVGGSWTWTMHVANTGNAGAAFAATEVVLLDNLPTGVTYGTPVVANFTGVTSGNLSAALTGNDLTVTATGPFILLAGGSFDVTITATPTVAGTFANPSPGGTAEVDPDNHIREPNEANNTTRDTVTVNAQSAVPPAQPAISPESPPSPPAPVRRFAVGAGPGSPARVQVYDASNGQLVQDFDAYAGHHGGVSVALGDVNGDGVPDLVTGALNGPAHVKVFDGASGALLRSFLAFDGFLGGVDVGSWDIDGDGRADLIVGTATNSSHVKVFSGSDGSLIHSFLAFAGFTGGDVDGGKGDIVVSTATAFSHVKVFRGADGTELASFFAFAGFVGGVSVGAGDVDGDGRADIVVGTATAFSHVKAFDGATGAERASFFAYAGFQGGVSVGAVDRDGDGRADILTGAGSGAGPHVKAFRSGDLALLDSFFAFAPDFSGGLGVTG